MRAFQVKVNGKILDYRNGQDVNLKDAYQFFSKRYQVDKIWLGGRHVLGVLTNKKRKLFLKMATSEGIGAVTKNEFDWNDFFNNQIDGKRSEFVVPKNYQCGFFKNNLFFMITEKFDGEMISRWPTDKRIDLIEECLNRIVDFAEVIASLRSRKKLLFDKEGSYREYFWEKTNAWFSSIPQQIRKRFAIDRLLYVVEHGIKDLEMAPRHGDFAPWHLMKLKNGKLGLIDGEHAKINGVRGYDLAYLIQRVFCVLKNPKLANSVLKLLDKENHKIKNIKTILTARAIGGFLDEYLSKKPDYSYAVKFKKWVGNL